MCVNKHAFYFTEANVYQKKNSYRNVPVSRNAVLNILKDRCNYLTFCFKIKTEAQLQQKGKLS